MTNGRELKPTSKLLKQHPAVSCINIIKHINSINRTSQQGQRGFDANPKVFRRFKNSNELRREFLYQPKGSQSIDKIQSIDFKFSCKSLVKNHSKHQNYFEVKKKSVTST